MTLFIASEMPQILVRNERDEKCHQKRIKISSTYLLPSLVKTFALRHIEAFHVHQRGHD